MRYCALFIFGLAFLLGCAGCASAEKSGEEKKEKKPLVLADFDVNGNEAVKTAAQRFAEGMFQALKEDDFTLWQKEIPATFSHKITPESFKKMRAEFLLYFGIPESCEFLGVLDQGKLRDCLWKFRFVKPQDNAPGLPHEIICWVRVYREDSKPPAVGGFGFHPF